MLFRNTRFGVSNMVDTPLRALAGYGHLVASQKRFEMPSMKGTCGQQFFCVSDLQQCWPMGNWDGKCFGKIKLKTVR